MKYKFTLNGNYENSYPHLSDVYFFNEWCYINRGKITIRRGYSWNGISFGINTPDTKEASLIHDCMYQFAPISRKEADVLFLYILTKNNFKFAKLYYFAVRIFGGLFYAK